MQNKADSLRWYEWFLSFRTHRRSLSGLLLIAMIMLGCRSEQTAHTRAPLPPNLQNLFAPPPQFAGEMGSFRSPLLFDSGEKVQNKKIGKRGRKRSGANGTACS